MDPVADDRGSRQTGSLDSLALRTIPVESTRQPPALTNVAFERRFSSPQRNPFPAWNPGPNEIRNYRLSDVVLDGLFRGLFNEHGYIRGTSYIIPDEEMMAVAVDPVRLVQDLDDSMVVIGCNHVAPDNYFHWITQALPAIDFTLSRAGQDRRIRLALPVLTQWQEDTLRLLGYSGVSRVTLTDPSKQYSFNQVEYSELLRGEATFRWSETIHRTFSRLRAAVDQVRHEGRKLYVARTDASRRVMRNEGSIIAELQQRGFEIATPGILSFAEQVRLFRDASLIVGAHGAGMTNIVFCEPDTIVYELLSTHYRNACFCSLTHVCGLRYWADAFDSEGEGTPFLRDWESDTTLVMQRLTEIEAIQADLREEARQTIDAMDFLRGFVGP